MWNRIKVLFIPIFLSTLMLNSIYSLANPENQSVVQAIPLSNPMVVALNPPANNHTQPVTTLVSIQYDQPISPTSVNSRTFVVHAMQTGLITQSFAVHNDFAYLTPTKPFKPGELVYVSATTGTFNLAGEQPITPTVWQFQAETSPTIAQFDQTEQPLDTFGHPYVVALGDLDRDGDLDAVFGNSAGNSFWLNEGNGSFIYGGNLDWGYYWWTVHIVLGDLDNDGDLDIMAANSGPNQVYFNDGHGHFTESSQTLGDEHTIDVALADLDGDGDLDAAAANNNFATDTIWMNDGSGFFSQAQSLSNEFNSMSITAGDIDIDGDLDLVEATEGPNKIWLNDGNGQFSDSGQALGTSRSQSARIGDFDNDSDLDFVVVNETNENHFVWLNDGNGIFSISNTIPSLYYGGDVEIGDLDGDTDLDILITNLGGDGCEVWLNDGHAVFTKTGFLDNDIYEMDSVLGDLDGDGDLDALVANYSEPSQVWLNANPIYYLTATNDSPTLLGNSTRFSATVSGSNIEYLWNLGDGTIVSGEEITHTYATTGTFTAIVTASNSFNQLVTTTRVTIFDDTDIPIEGLTVTNDSPTLLGQTTHFTASILTGTNVIYSWDFGDGTSMISGNLQVVDHVYANTGIFTATITAINESNYFDNVRLGL